MIRMCVEAHICKGLYGYADFGVLPWWRACVSEHLIIVDDDATLRNRLKKYFEKEGFRVSAADGGAQLRDIMDRDSADLVILDLMMPGEDGLSLTSYLRQSSDAGVVILTGKGDTVDRVVGLELGADDYISKPFELRELLARIRSVLRRTGRVESVAADEAPGASAGPDTDCVEFDGWRFDLERRQLTSPDGEEIHLTTAEFNLLRVFVRNPERPLSRDKLLDEVGGRDWQPFDRSIDLHISHLRRKLEENPKAPRLIKTVRSAGYIFAASVTKTG
jgi:DNA-binding response OmpR family regulator